MAMTALALVQELARRNDELIISTPTATGTTTTLIDTGLNQYMPQDTGTGNARLLCWVYCNAGDTANVGQERRAQSFSANSSTLTFFSGAGAWPVAPTSAGTYELHLRSERSRKLEAINSAVRQLGLTWYRVFQDTSITTAINQWTYTIPSADNMSKVSKVEIQISTQPTLIGYPYIDASPWNWVIRESTDTSGNLTQILQFGVVPPPNRTLRITMEGWYPNLANDSDVLPLSGKWAGPATEFIYDWATYRLMQWQEHGQPAGELGRYQALSREDLQAALERVLRLAPPHLPGRVVIPGSGDGQYPAGAVSNDPAFLGAYNSQGVVNP
jgi:hypothetical protein